AKVTAIKESKDLSSLALDELIDNIKVNEVVMEKDFEIYKGKKERVKSIALKAKKESSDDETSTFGNDDEEYVMAARNFKKFFRRKERVTGNVLDASDSENDAEDKTNEETCLMAQSSNEVTLNSSCYSDNASSLDNHNMQIEYDSLCEISLKIINKNKILKTKRDLLEKEILELNEKIKKLKRSKEIEIAYSQNSKACVVYNKHTMKVEESLNVTFDESPPPTKLSPLVDDDVGEEEATRKNTKIVNTNNEKDESIEVDEIVNIKESKNYPLDQVIGNLNQRTLRSQA
ncbi:hypothetical protein Tco_0389409, partial [Tanacetum coccineum]